MRVLPQLEMEKAFSRQDNGANNALLRPCFPGKTRPFSCTRSNPSQGRVPTGLT